jgi:hypothetical protein
MAHVYVPEYVTEPLTAIDEILESWVEEHALDALGVRLEA